MGSCPSARLSGRPGHERSAGRPGCASQAVAARHGGVGSGPGASRISHPGRGTVSRSGRSRPPSRWSWPQGRSGRGGDPGAAIEGAGGDVVEFGFLGDVNERKKFKALFTEFNEQYPEIDLQATAKSGSWAQFTYAVDTQIAAGFAAPRVPLHAAATPTSL
ncbi:hypothetical protein [Brachybacterium sacelli]|uniref:hypothetical protein n=1 Tax=Brachybacterium sacelli TaxID=173364 RepID=UPI00338230F2